MSLRGEEFLTPTEHIDICGSVANTFTLLPLHKLGRFSPGQTVTAVLATYEDPLAGAAERSYTWLPRWQQTVELAVSEVDELSEPPSCMLRDWQLGVPRLDKPAYAADVLFRGIVKLQNVSTAAHGTIHPRVPGWIKLDGLNEELEPLLTIADLKARLGKISPDFARLQNQRRRSRGSFLVRGAELR